MKNCSKYRISKVLTASVITGRLRSSTWV